MKALFQLALRNLREHKSKTIIIALFIIFGSAIVILGNAFLESVNRGLERDFRANYTGDIVISAKPKQGQVIDIMGVQSISLVGDIPQLPALTEVERINQKMSEDKRISKTTRLISAQALMTKDEEFEVDMEEDSLSIMDIPVFFLFAGEDKTYFDTFGGQHVVEGRMIDYSSGQNELFIDTRVRESFEKFYKQPLNVGDKVLVAGANTNGVIREATVVGFFTPPNENSAMFQIIYCNPSFARAFADLTYGASIASTVSTNVDTSIVDFDDDDLFGSDDDWFSDIDTEGSILASDSVDFNDILGDTTLRDELNKTDEGAWHFILGKVQHPSEADKIVAEYNAWFEEEGINAVAMNWENGAISYTSSVEGIGILFNILVIILAVVVFIIIMNTMTVSVIERTSEIGTMRALGAEKSFVRKLFFTEALLMTIGSALIGTVIAAIAAVIFNAFNITITNSIAKIILGGGQLRFIITPGIIIATIIITAIGGFLSNLYPVSSALKITPLKALSKGAD